MMYNSQRPSSDDLPSSGQLLRATGFAVLVASAILVTVVLPAEYAIDPTGAGRMLGFTQMGEIKTQLAKEAAADALMVEADAPSAMTQAAPAGSDADAGADRSDVTELTLAPGQAAEVKATMKKDASMEFAWSVAGGAVNFDTHADSPSIEYYGYGKGSNSTGEQGTLVAAFSGRHGWYWRNRSDGIVTITLHTDGTYSDIGRAL